MKQNELDALIKKWQIKLGVDNWKIISEIVPPATLSRLSSDYVRKKASIEIQEGTREEMELNVIRFCIHLNFPATENRTNLAETVITTADRLYNEDKGHV